MVFITGYQRLMTPVIDTQGEGVRLKTLKLFSEDLWCDQVEYYIL